MQRHCEYIAERRRPSDYRKKVFGDFKAAHAKENTYYNEENYMKGVRKKAYKDKLFPSTPKFFWKDKGRLYYEQLPEKQQRRVREWLDGDRADAEFRRGGERYSLGDKDTELTSNRKEGEGDAPAREEFLEPFGLLHNVNIAPEQHRHLVEGYGQEATDATIDDLSCKLADGTVDSSNHYATLLSWLRYQRRNGGIVPLSSSKADPMTEREKTLRIAWDATSEEGRQEYLEDHEGLLPWEYERKHQQS
jgi:hypothetical protein